MQDPFIDPSDDLMTRATDLPLSETATASPPPMAPTKHVCPFCGSINENDGQSCPRCTMEDTAQTRAATKARIGPWYVLQKRNPAAPGMKWATLLALVAKGQVTERSIVRGPTTHQLWRAAGHVKGLSREFGLCYNCGGRIERTANQCPHCDKLQEPPVNPDVLLEGRESMSRPRAAQMPAPAAIEPIAATAALPQPPQGDLALRRSNEMRPATDAGILSAKELAAAFQLDFQPAAESSSHKRSILRTLVLLIFLALLGGIIFLYLRPEYRAPVQAWFDERFDSVKTYVTDAGATGSTPPAMGAADPLDEPFPLMEESVPPAEVEQPEPPVTPQTPRVQPEPSPPVPAPPAELAVPPAVVETPRVEAPPVESAPPPVQPEPPPPAPVEQAPVEEPPPVVVEAVPAPQPVERPRPRTPAADPATQAKALRDKAIDAEARRDWQAALQHYEAIKKLPHEVHHLDLDLRIARVRERIESR